MKIFLLAGVLLALAFPFSGCLMPTTSSGSDAGATSKLDFEAGTGSGPASGTGCGTDPTTGITLCTGTSECPGLVVDQSVFYNCGFYISGAALDLECLCATSLCPMGAAPSCAAAQALLASSNLNEGTVCLEVSSGGCSQIPVSGGGGTAGSGAGGTAGSGTTEAGSCDMTCESMCAGEPDCIQACGC
jgi:hypothetical protein